MGSRYVPRSSQARLVLWGLVVLLVLLLLEKKRSEKKRSGQAGLLVPKAATTARVSLPPFATCEEGKCLAGINDISPRR